MEQKQQWGALILRLILGVTFLVHGLAKFLGGIDQVAGWFESIGIPGFLATVVAVIELVGGAALILGIGTRIISVLFTIILAVAIFKVKLSAGFMGNGQMPGYEFDLSLLAIAIYLALNGSTLFAIDSLLPFGKKENNQSSNPSI